MPKTTDIIYIFYDYIFMKKIDIQQLLIAIKNKNFKNVWVRYQGVDILTKIVYFMK